LLSETKYSPLDLALMRDDRNKHEALNKLGLQHYNLSVFGNNVSVTKRELDVLRYISQGCTIKETARYINLSPRTVENYFNNVKFKIGSKRKSEIIKIISEAKLL
jgi:DNA-binding CsgD family transcriptional regulator